MATALSILGVYFLLLLSFVQSRHVRNPFGFIQHLEGSHRGQSVKGLKDIKLYLGKYGYLDYDQVVKKHAEDDEFDDLLESAVKKFQQFYGLNVTGGLDSDTLKQITTPRCSVPDFVNGSRSHHHHNMPIRFVRHYQFFPGSPKWPSDLTALTYQIRNSAQANLSLDVSSILERAFEKWSDVLQLFTIQEVSEGSDSLLEINFHGTQVVSANDEGFDGFQGVLAHATGPVGSETFLHFDEDEVWGSIPESSELDLQSVALHEMGHVLGLAHSAVNDAIMFPTFSYGITKRDLAEDDIDGILDLYNSEIESDLQNK